MSRAASTSPLLHLLVLIDRDRADDAGELAGDIDLGERLQRARRRDLDGEIGLGGRDRGVINLGGRTGIPLIEAKTGGKHDQGQQRIEPATPARLAPPVLIEPERRLDGGIRFRLWQIDNLVHVGPL
ncbi:hypothetical protein GCM10007881_30370 [Mesorhizobium huakuii]|nr:hypothetical protein GCM10007881_30370 [Mesorhizobium huakuii]